MGIAFKLTLYASRESQAEEAASAAYARVGALEQVLSDYRPTSEASDVVRRAAYGPVPVSEDLYRVLSHALKVAEASDGAFDPTVGPLVALWREARRSSKLPEPLALAAAKAKVDWRCIELDPRRRTVFLKKVGVKFDFGGIGKGDACDQALAVLRRKGVRRAMVEAGGDLKVGDPPPGAAGWRVAVAGHPETLLLANRAVSTSGDAEQFVEIGGVRYSHIVDPRTGLGLTNRIQATAIAKEGLTTDPLATALCVLGPDGSGGLLRRFSARAVFVGGTSLFLARQERGTPSAPRNPGLELGRARWSAELLPQPGTQASAWACGRLKSAVLVRPRLEPGRAVWLLWPSAPSVVPARSSPNLFIETSCPPESPVIQFYRAIVAAVL
jgi:FAD:protein FMN transferase